MCVISWEAVWDSLVDLLNVCIPRFASSKDPGELQGSGGTKSHNRSCYNSFSQVV